MLATSDECMETRRASSNPPFRHRPPLKPVSSVATAALHTAGTVSGDLLSVRDVA